MIINSANRLSEVKEYYFSIKLAEIAKMNEEGKDVINLGIGNPDLTPSTSTINKLIETANSTVKNTHGYQSYRGIPALKKAMNNWYAETYKVDTQKLHFVPLMGSKEGIMHISMAFLNVGDAVLFPNPGYPTYASVANLLQAKSITYTLAKENNWYPNFEELEKLVKENEIKILWINYPNMPTGANARYSIFKELVDFANQHKILLVHDNPYSLILNETPLSIFCVEGAEEVAIELNSLSKSHNMAGWRVGMLVGRSDYIDTIMKVKTNFDSGMFKAVQAGAIEALNNDKNWHKLQNETYRKRKKIACSILDFLECEYDKNGVGMFVWAKIPEKYSSGKILSDLILEKTNVFITPGFIFGSQGEQYIRISLCVNVLRLTEAYSRIKSQLKL